MKIQPLYDLQQEVNRLFIAGSKFAKNDPRLLKLIPVFQKLGLKAPVFNKLASAISDLVKADSTETSEKLSAISTLLYSILYTQGEMSESEVEQKKQVPFYNLTDVTTSYSYLELKPVIKALSENNPGRLEVIKDADKKGIFKDFRTFAYLNKALGDKYTELAGYAEKIIKENTGKSIITILRDNFSHEGRTEDVRRLSLLHYFNYVGLKDIIDKIMEGNAVNLQAEAIRILSEDISNEDFIIELASDKNKIIREAAYMGLAAINTEKSQNKLTELYIKNRKINKTNTELLVKALSKSDLKFSFNEIFNQIRLSFDEFINSNEKTDNKIFISSIENLHANISILSKRDKPEIYEFLMGILLDNRYNNLIKGKAVLLSKFAENISRTIVEQLSVFSNEKKLLFLDNIYKNMPQVSWKIPFYKKYFYECVKMSYPPACIYDMFSKAYDAHYISLDDLIKAYSGKTNDYYVNVSDITDISILDRRWIDKLYVNVEKSKNNSVTVKMLQLIDTYESAPCEKFDNLLKIAVKQLDLYSVPVIFKIILRRDFPDKYEFIYSVINDANFGKQNYYYSFLVESDIWNNFPKEYASKFNEMNTKKKIKAFEEIAHKIATNNN